jgi:phage/plasmid-like protein (TIGR03299 family)
MQETFQGYKPSQVEDWVANVRSDTGETLGIVGKGYKVVQNKEAFAFTDLLLGEGVRYESAGSLRAGRRVWLLAKMPETKILGDKVEPYLVFSNGHDGNAAVKVAMTPVRVVCMNTLNIALSGASRFWSTSHQGDIAKKLEDAQRTLELATKYMDALDEASQRLADIQITKDLLADITTQLFPLPKDQKRHSLVYEMRKEFMFRYEAAPDLARFRGTGWGVVNAASDFAGHRTPKRVGPTHQENKFSQIIGGHPVIDRAVDLVLATVA